MNLEDLTRSSGEWLRGTGPESDIVMCSRIRLARNLADFNFTNRATRNEKSERANAASRTTIASVSTPNSA